MMILKYISFESFNIKASFDHGIKKISQLNNFNKIMTYFWILGPIIYLIERDPADLWLTSIAFIFLIRCILLKDWIWTGQLWFIFAVLLCITGLISALLGPYNKFSFLQGLVWIRFPIYVAAAQVWLGQDRDIRMVMFVSTLFGMLIMCLILVFELMLSYQTITEYKTLGSYFYIFIYEKHGLSWPYGDYMSGSYLAKVSLPIYCTLITVAIYKFGKNSLVIYFISITTLIITFLSNDRVNFLIRFFSGLLAIFSSKKNTKNLFLSLIIIFFSSLLLALIFFITNKKIIESYSKKFYSSIPILNMDDKNSHWGAWRSGIQQGIHNPILGLGPSSSRKHCKNLVEKDINWLPGKNYCGNHPHNFYIQLFAETGIIGLLNGSLMFYFIFITCYRVRLSNPNCHISSICYIIPLALFFPFQQTGSFFSQWGNLFIWFPIGFCIAQVQDYKSIFKK